MKASKAKLKEAITRASSIAFRKIVEEKSDEQIFAFSLVTRDDVLCCYAYANTIESHRRTLQKNADLIKRYNIEENEFKWSPAEWAYTCIGEDEFNEVYALSEKIQSQLSDKDFYPYKLSFLEMMVEAMISLKKEGIFAEMNRRNEITLFASILDSFGAEELEAKSSRILNSELIHKEFVWATKKSS